ncbi:hypothetical protein BDQ17DRAFT_1333002 [Cyathus striatus]|nr:hypothetical protein BDQ17DRAFT_1333002 [Cyathus striatus]
MAWQVQHASYDELRIVYPGRTKVWRTRSLCGVGDTIGSMVRLSTPESDATHQCYWIVRLARAQSGLSGGVDTYSLAGADKEIRSKYVPAHRVQKLEVTTPRTSALLDVPVDGSPSLSSEWTQRKCGICAVVRPRGIQSGGVGRVRSLETIWIYDLRPKFEVCMPMENSERICRYGTWKNIEETGM